MPRPSRSSSVILGMAVVLAQPACKYPGSNYVPPPRPAPGSSPAATVPARPPALEASEERLLAWAAHALECLEKGSLEDASEEIRAIPEGILRERPAELIQELLRRKLERLLEIRRKDPPRERDVEGALKELREGHLLIKQSRNDKALIRLEQAHGLDRENPQIAEALVSLLKQVGLESYVKGDSANAVVYWRRVLEIHPGDPETLRFLQRANDVMKKR